jgi:archaetidylinositol phosphate synthase
MGIYSTKSKWQQALRPFVALCARNQIHPDVFTYGALVLSFVAAFALLRAGAHRAWLWLVPPCVLVRLLLNLMDGLVAREVGLADTWGEAKNEFWDRVADAAIFLGLSFGGYADARLAALAIALILCVSYLGILGKALGGPRLYGGVFGKGDRMISLAAFTLYPLFSGNLASYNWYLAFATLAAAATVVQRLRMIYGHTKPSH